MRLKAFWFSSLDVFFFFCWRYNALCTLTYSQSISILHGVVAVGEVWCFWLLLILLAIYFFSFPWVVCCSRSYDDGGFVVRVIWCRVNATRFKFWCKKKNSFLCLCRTRTLVTCCLNQKKSPTISFHELHFCCKNHAYTPTAAECIEMKESNMN